MEVAYTGIRQTPQAIAAAAKQHEAEVIGLSILSGAHLTLFPLVLEALSEQGIGPEDVLLLAGGIIPDDDISTLREMGFAAVYGPGTDTRELIEYIQRSSDKTWAGGPDPLKRRPPFRSS